MSFSEFFKRFATVLGILLIIAGLWAARATLLMGFAAAVLAIAISIPARRLQRRGWRRPLALAAASAGAVLIVLALILWLVPSLLAELGGLATLLPDAARALLAIYDHLRSSSAFLGAALPAPPQWNDLSFSESTAQALFSRFLTAGLAAAPILLSGAGGLMTMLINVFLVFVVAIFFLIDPHSYVKAGLFLLPAGYHARALDICNQLYHTVCTWIATLAVSITVTMTLVWLILGAGLGLPNVMVVAVFAGFATFIPNLGEVLPIIPIVIITLAYDPSRMLIMIPAYIAIQSLEGYVITPSLNKAELKIPAAGLLLFQLLITIAFGALGLLMATPLLAVLIVLVREIYSYDWLGLRGVTVKL